LKALTLHRPWSDAIARGPKRVENRTWTPPADMLGRFIAIHAGKRFDDGVGIALTAMGSGWDPPLDDAESPQGIVGIARLIGVADRRGDKLRLMVPGFPMPGVANRLELLVDDRWWAGPVGWLLDDVLAIEPVPCRGAQGLWLVPPEVDALVRARAGAR
jgi:hypothetical protein